MPEKKAQGLLSNFVRISQFRPHWNGGHNPRNSVFQVGQSHDRRYRLGPGLTNGLSECGDPLKIRGSRFRTNERRAALRPRRRPPKAGGAFYNPLPIR